MIGRRRFLAGLAAAAAGPLPPWRVPRSRAAPVQTWPVYATLVGVTKGGGQARSEPVQFDARWAVPPLVFRKVATATWTHVEMTDGERVRHQDLYPSVATWSGEDLTIGGTTWE